jgi:hypothetical protein
MVVVNPNPDALAVVDACMPADHEFAVFIKIIRASDFEWGCSN